MKIGRRTNDESALSPSVVYRGRSCSPEGIRWAKARDRARRRALERMRTVSPVEFEAAWDKTGGSGTQAYSRNRMAALRAVAQAHPAEYRSAYEDELAKES